jgi:Flp pilus assembly protein TadD
MSDYRRDVVIGLTLGVLALAAHSGVTANDFIDYDDPEYVTHNPQVKNGLTAEGLRWAWTTFRTGNWHPLTWMSLQLDAQLYGLNPAGFHLTNLLLHGANVVLLFGVLRGMTGAVGRSAVVAALFAVHPLHVESVAWVAERKDVLSTLGGLLTLAAYARYAAWPSVGRYLVVMLTLTLGLLAKPMLVTLPCVLLLLDYWPLGRFQAVSVRRLVLEKLPLLALSAVFSAITLVAQRHGEALPSLEHLPLGTRLATALIGYLDYLRTTIWPSGLAVFYPYPSRAADWSRAALAAVVLAGVTAAVIRSARRRPYLAVGWFWFMGTLVPVIGLVQVGEQVRADRYTYVPNIGLYLMAAWGLGELAVRWRSAVVPAGIALLALAACLFLTRQQVEYWKDARTLWEHTAAVTRNNYRAHYGLGIALLQQGKMKEGIAQLKEVLRIGYDTPAVRKNLGAALVSQGRAAEAAAHLREALRREPDSAEIHHALGVALFQDGDLEGARAHLQEALRRRPDFAEAHLNLARLWLRLGRFDEAERHAREALRLEPDQAEGHNQLGIVLGRQRKWEEAAACFRRAMELQPGVVRYRCNLAHALHQAGQTGPARAEYDQALALSRTWPQAAAGEAWRLATHPNPKQRDGARAVELAEQACQATPSPDGRLLDVLAAAQAEAGRFDEAVQTAEQALKVLPAEQHPELGRQIRARLELYRQRQPFRQPASP